MTLREQFREVLEIVWELVKAHPFLIVPLVFVIDETDRAIDLPRRE